MILFMIQETILLLILATTKKTISKIYQYVSQTNILIRCYIKFNKIQNKCVIIKLELQNLNYMLNDILMSDLFKFMNSFRPNFLNMQKITEQRVEGCIN